MSPHPLGPRARLVVPGLLAASSVAIALAGCGSEPAEVTSDEYLAAIEEVCVETTATLDALPDPPEQISVTDFAASASSALGNEASRLARIEAPADLDADHRALVRNTEEQAAAWRTVADAGADDEGFADTTTLIAQLLLGRNDLVDELGATGCRRGAG
jgi:hypothetical protein